MKFVKPFVLFMLILSFLLAACGAPSPEQQQSSADLWIVSGSNATKALAMETTTFT
jgi:hypothetical protein